MPADLLTPFGNLHGGCLTAMVDHCLGGVLSGDSGRIMGLRRRIQQPAAPVSQGALLRRRGRNCDRSGPPTSRRARGVRRPWNRDRRAPDDRLDMKVKSRCPLAAQPPDSLPGAPMTRTHLHGDDGVTLAADCYRRRCPR